MKINKPGLDGGRRGRVHVCKSPASLSMQRCRGLPQLQPVGLEALKSNECIIEAHSASDTSLATAQIKFERGLLHQERHQKKCSRPGFFLFAPPFS